MHSFRDFPYPSEGLEPVEKMLLQEPVYLVIIP